MDSDMGRRDCLKSIFATFVAALAMLVAPSIGRCAAAQNGPTMDSAHRSKLILLLRKRGVRGGLDAKIAAVLGLYNRGDNLPVSRMSMRKDNRILSFARVAMRNRELYYWGFQPDLKVLTRYFFLTDWEFRLVARGVELVDGKATAMPSERATAMFGEVIKDWITILNAL